MSNIKIITTMILALSMSVGAIAQDTIMYRGGVGDGFNRVYANSYSPTILNNNVAYMGSQGDGHSVMKLINFAPGLLNNNMPYAGNKGDGFSVDKAANFVPIIINNNVAYLGNVGDGYGTGNFVAFNRTMINNYFAYAGGIGDGWSNELAQSVSLPLVLLSFEGQVMGDHNALTWTTSIEENVDYFLVEKSKDGIHFAGIGNVNAVGNSTAEQTYDYNDRQDVQGINFYKLRMTDIDNTYKYSKIIKLINKKLDYTVLIAPNPAQENISIRLSRALEASSEFVVLDISGKVILREKISKDEATKNIKIKSLAPGQYLIYLNLANDSMSLPFIKN